MSFIIRASLVAVLSLNVTATANAADTVRLSSLATASGYTYEWSSSDSGVTLQRPGVVIILHAGYPLYEVNAIPVQADSAPRFEGGDLVVSQALANRIRRIAIAHPQPRQPLVNPSSPNVAFDGTAGSMAGALTINARQIPGREALTLSGTAPANVPVTITLTGEPSRDLPIVVINRTTVMSASDGTYSAVASIGQDTHRGTTIAATATSYNGVTAASARIIVDAPSPRVNSILDEFPPK